jgi:type I restriction enzyme S subunit
MRDGWRLVPLGAVATLAIEKVPVVPGHTYEVAGVLNAGQGMMRRDPIDGADTNYPALHRLRAGQLVMRKLTAWEGPITIVPVEYEGLVVSTEFPTFTLKTEELLPAFMNLVCQRPQFWERMRVASTGSVQRRKRVNPSQLLAIEIPLPPVREQHRIVDLIGAVDRQTDAVDRLSKAADAALTAEVTRLGVALDDRSTIHLGDVAEIAGGITKDAKKQAEDFVEVPYLRVANVQRGFFDLRGVTTIRAPLDKVRRLALQSGDVLFNEGGDRDKLGRGWVWEGEITPCIHQNHVFRARLRGDQFDPYFVSIWGNSPHGQRWFETMGSQTTNLASINMRTLRAFPLPDVDRPTQQHVVDTYLAFRGVRQASWDEVDSLRTVRTTLLADLLDGVHVIPDSYDALLGRAS